MASWFNDFSVEEIRRAAFLGVAAGVSVAVAAGAIDVTAFLNALTPYIEDANRPSFLAGQLRWAASGAALFFALVGLMTLFFNPPRKVMDFPIAGVKTWVWLLFLVLTSLALRCAYVGLNGGPAVSDERAYLNLARSINTGEGYCEDGRPTAYWPPGLPVIISFFFRVCGPSVYPVLYFQCLLGVGTVVSVWFLGRLLVGEGAARVASLIVAFWPNGLAYVARLFPAAVMIFAGVAVFALFAASPRFLTAAAAGVLVGLATLTAPVMFPVAPLTATVDISMGRGWKLALRRAVYVTVIAVVVVLPWTYRNWSVFGTFVPVSTNAGIILWMGNNPAADGSYNFPINSVNPLLNETDEVKRDRLALRLSREFIFSRPWDFVKLIIPKLANLYGTDVSAFQYEDLARGLSPEAAGRRWPARVSQFYYGGIWGAAAYGLFKLRRRLLCPRGAKAPSLVCVLAYITYFSAVYSVFHGLDRYHLPVIPMVAILAGGLAAEARQGGDMAPL